MTLVSHLQRMIFSERVAGLPNTLFQYFLPKRPEMLRNQLVDMVAKYGVNGLAKDLRRNMPRFSELYNVRLRHVKRVMSR